MKEIIKEETNDETQETLTDHCLVNAGEPDTQDESDSLLTSSVRIIAHPHAKSLVWKHFGFVPLGDSNTPDRRRVLCRLCYRELPYCNNTTNLQYHLQRNHKEVVGTISGVREIRTTPARTGRRTSRVPERFRDSGDPEESHVPSRKRSLSMRVTACSLLTPTVTLEESEFVPAGNMGPCTAWNWQNSTPVPSLAGVVLRAILKDCLPLSTIEGSGFQEIVRLLDPNFEFHSLHQLRSQVVPSLYVEEKRRILASLRGNKFCSLSFDTWHPRNSTAVSYVGVACHFINSEWNLDSRYLATLETSRSQLPSDFSHQVQRLLCEWRIQSEMSISGCTAGEEGERCVPSSLNFLQIPHVPCLASVLQNAATKAMQVLCVNTALSKLRRFSESLRQSPELRLRFQERLAESSLPDTAFDFQDAAWFQVYSSLVRLHSSRDSFTDILSDTAGLGANILLTDEDWKALDALEAVLRPLNEAADTLSNESYLPASLVLPLLFRLTRVSLAVSSLDSELLSELKKTVRDSLGDAYDGEETQDLLRMAMFLDPRLKRLPFYSHEEKNALYKVVRRHLVQLVQEDNGAETSFTNLENGTSPLKRSRLTSVLGDIFSQDSIPDIKPRITRDQTYIVENILKQELQCYNDEEPISLEETEPLHWWKDREHQYPHLSNLARKVLCITATAVPMRRLLSEEGQSWNVKRASLPREDLFEILFLSHNQRHEAGIP